MTAMVLGNAPWNLDTDPRDVVILVNTIYDLMTEFVNEHHVMPDATLVVAADDGQVYLSRCAEILALPEDVVRDVLRTTMVQFRAVAYVVTWHTMGSALRLTEAEQAAMASGVPLDQIVAARLRAGTLDPNRRDRVLSCYGSDGVTHLVIADVATGRPGHDLAMTKLKDVSHINQFEECPAYPWAGAIAAPTVN